MDLARLKGITSEYCCSVASQYQGHIFHKTGHPSTARYAMCQGQEDEGNADL